LDVGSVAFKAMSTKTKFQKPNLKKIRFFFVRHANDKGTSQINS
jgi:hypothetical protein